MAREQTSVVLKVYLLDQSRPGMEEGVIYLQKNAGEPIGGQIHFDRLSDVPDKIRELLSRADIVWPRQPSGEVPT